MSSRSLGGLLGAISLGRTAVSAALALLLVPAAANDARAQASMPSTFENTIACGRT
jgi:hypothetical protein